MTTIQSMAQMSATSNLFSCFLDKSRDLLDSNRFLFNCRIGSDEMHFQRRCLICQFCLLHCSFQVFSTFFYLPFIGNLLLGRMHHFITFKNQWLKSPSFFINSHVYYLHPQQCCRIHWYRCWRVRQLLLVPSRPLHFVIVVDEIHALYLVGWIAQSHARIPLFHILFRLIFESL